MTERYTILHIEDDGDFVTLVKEVLQDYDVEIATRYDEAMVRLKSGNHYDLALVNLHLTDYNEGFGKEILEYIRDHRPSLPRIVITGAPFSGPVFTEFRERYEVSELFRKLEFDGTQLRGAIRRILGRKLVVKPFQIHTEIPRHIVHLYHAPKLRTYPRLQLFEFVIEGPPSSLGEISVVLLSP